MKVRVTIRYVDWKQVDIEGDDFESIEQKAKEDYLNGGMDSNCCSVLYCEEIEK